VGAAVAGAESAAVEVEDLRLAFAPVHILLVCMHAAQKESKQPGRQAGRRQPRDDRPPRHTRLYAKPPSDNRHAGWWPVRAGLYGAGGTHSGSATRLACLRLPRPLSPNSLRAETPGSHDLSTPAYERHLAGSLPRTSSAPSPHRRISLSATRTAGPPLCPYQGRLWRRLRPTQRR
jgi:hypothetical protein